jgi:hypothetical protein
LKHYFLIPGLKSTYEKAYLAQFAAHKLLKQKPYHLRFISKKAAVEDLTRPVYSDATAEDMIIFHYKNMAENMKDRIMGLDLEKDTKVQREIAFGEIMSLLEDFDVIEEQLEDEKDKREIRDLKNYILRLKQEKLPDFAGKKKEDIQSKKPNQQPNQPDKGTRQASIQASVQTEESTAIESNFAKELTEDDIALILEEYAKLTGDIISKEFPDCTYKIDLKNRDIEFLDKDSDNLITISINDTVNVDSIIPYGKLEQLYPFHSWAFYQKFWKPIVENIGHVIINDRYLVVADGELPNLPSDTKNSDIVSGWDIKDQKAVDISFSFDKKDKHGIDSSWLAQNKTKTKTVSAAATTAKDPTSKYTEEDYTNKRAMCTNPDLETIYNKIGEIIQTIPHPSGVMADINFGRATVRLREKDYQLIN